MARSNRGSEGIIHNKMRRDESRVMDEKTGKDIRQEKKGRGDERRRDERSGEERRRAEREREKRPSLAFLTFKTHYLKVLVEAAYCLMCGRCAKGTRYRLLRQSVAELEQI